MSVITIRLPDKLLCDVDHYAKASHLARAEYIRYAIENMNKEIKKKERAEKLKKASLRARKESMRVNKEFSRIEDDFED